MRWRVVPAFLLTGAVVLFILGFGGWLVLQRSLPQENARWEAPVRDSVVVWRDAFGIPAVSASSITDAVFALGYLHAQDRLWQMELARRLATGRLAEILGRDALPFDLLMRAIGFERLARRLWDSLHPLSRTLLRRYSEGVNFWLQHHRSRLPPEFLLLGCVPEAWNELHSLAIARLMAFDLAFCFWSDIAMGALAEELGVERAVDLIPGYPPSAPTVVDDFVLPFPPLPDTTAAALALSPAAAPPPGFRDWATTVMTPLRSLLGRSAGQGSNAWAVRIPGGSVLANDPHLLLGLPARWYPVSILSPEYEVGGLTLPGLPLVIIGRNRSIAWGVTNLMADESDFFIERVDTAQPHRYWDGSRWRLFERWRDTIRIRRNSPLVVEFARSHNGPIISAFHLFNAPRALFRQAADTAPNPFLRRYRLSYRWAAAEAPSDELWTVYQLGRARSWEHFREALRTWGAPVLCFVYADRNGTVGVSAAGYLPRRDTTVPETAWAFPLPGWEAQYRWLGVFNATSLPPLVRPRYGFVISANQKFSRSARFSYIWEPPSRAQRLVELLQRRGVGYSSRDAERMQLDVISPYAREMMDSLAPLLERIVPRDSVERRGLEYLRGWNAEFSQLSIGAAVYAVFLQRLLVRTFGTHLTQRGLREYFFLSNLALRRLAELIGEPSSPWFDNPQTPERETLPVVVQESFREAIAFLRQRFGDDPAQWQYGRLHTLRLSHLLGLHPLLRPLFSRGPYPAAGAMTTVNTGEWRLWEPFEQTLGASARFVADMANDSLWSVVLPGGVSGHCLSPHYTDQLSLWLHGGMVHCQLGRPQEARQSLKLVPIGAAMSPVGESQ